MENAIDVFWLFDAMDDFIGEARRVCEMQRQEYIRDVGLRFSVLNCQDCQQQDTCVSNSADELQEDALMVLECVKSYLCASCVPRFPRCGSWN